MNKRRSYTKEFKIEAVRLFESSDKNGVETAHELGVRRNQLYKWQQELDSKGSDAFKGSGRKRASSETELARLKKENDQLREEIEILIKAAAYFARDMK